VSAGSCGGGEGGVGAYADDDQDEVRAAGDDQAVGSGGPDDEHISGRVARDRGDLGAGEDLDAVRGEFGVDERAKFRIDRRQDLGQGLDLGVLETAGGEPRPSPDRCNRRPRRPPTSGGARRGTA